MLVRRSDDWRDAHESDLGDEVRTCLGQEGIDIDLLQSWTSPFGQPLTSMTVPRRMLPGLAGAKLPPRAACVFARAELRQRPDTRGPGRLIDPVVDSARLAG